MSVQGRVSRVTSVQTALRNCIRDEGGPFGFGRQGPDPKPLQAAVVKSDGGERCRNVGPLTPAGKGLVAFLPSPVYTSSDEPVGSGKRTQ